MKSIRLAVLGMAALLSLVAAVAGTEEPQKAASTTYRLNWTSINSAGVINDSSASYRTDLSAGQPAVGTGSSPSYELGAGFWYVEGGVNCAAVKGDMNASGDLTPADVVHMLTCVFLGSGICDLCYSDVNCSGDLSPADAVIELNAVFLGAPFPC